MLLLVVFLVYAPSLTNGFALDDPIAASATLPSGAPNQMTSRLRPIADYFTSGYWIGNDGEVSPLYRPVTILSYALTNVIGADQAAFPHHLINVLLHVLAVFFVLRLLRLVVAEPRWALLGATVFGLHAIHSEVVAGIVGRAELFGFCFGAAALLLFAGARRTSDVGWVGRGLRFGASALCLFLAFGSKENAVAWAPFLLVFGWVEDRIHGRHRSCWRTGLQALLVAVIPLGLFFALRHVALAEVPSPFPIDRLANPLAHESDVVRMITGVWVWASYGLGKCLLPLDLVSDYGPVTIDIVVSPLDYRFLISVVVLVAALGLATWRARRHPLLFLGVACFLGFSFSTTNVPFTIGTVFGERLYFTPSLGIAIVVSWLFARLFPWLSTRVRRPALALLPVLAWLMMSCWVIVERNGAWADETSLTVHDAQRNPRCLRLLDAYAGHLDRLNRDDEAEVLWNRALALDPEFTAALSSYAGFLATKGRFLAAEKLFLRVLGTGDDQRLRHVTHFNLSLLYGQMQRPQASLAHLRAAWREPFAYQIVHEPLLTRTQKLLPSDEVERIVARGEQRAPGHPTWLLQRGYLALARDQPTVAIGWLRRALAARPRHPLTRWVLGATLLRMDRRAEAMPILESLKRDRRASAELRSHARRALRGA